MRQARNDEGSAIPTLQNGDVALLLDGGKGGLKNKLLNPWKEGTTKEKRAEEAEEEDGEEDEDGEDEEKPSLIATPSASSTQKTP